MTEDPLEKHHGLIAVAERGQLEGHAHMVGLQCIADLVAALRAERKNTAEAMNYFLDPHSPGSPPKYTDDYGPTLLNQIQWVAGYYEEMMDEDGAEIERLKARVAELETLLALSGEATIPYQTTSATHVAALEMARREEP